MEFDLKIAGVYRLYFILSDAYDEDEAPYLDEYQVVRIGGRSNHIDKKDSKVGLSRRSRSVGGVVTFSRSSRIVDMSCLIFRREITHRNEW